MTEAVRPLEPDPAAQPRRILLADDDPDIRRSYARVLTHAGYQVDIAADGTEAVALLAPGRHEAIVSDVDMPGMSGLEFLREVRSRDLDVPVLLITGGPTVEAAMRALEYGAFRYLPKPVASAVLTDALEHAIRLHGLARLKRQALDLLGEGSHQLGDRASLEARLGSALANLWMAFQPIVSLRKGNVVGYECLLRTDEPTLARPDHFLEAAERVGRLHEVGRRVRAQVAVAANRLPEGTSIFVNLHSADLRDDELYSDRAPLAAHARRVVLEITERASLDGISDVRGRVAVLRRLGYRIAVDDLGAGYAGLNSLAQLEPDVVKLDMSLIRGVDETPVKQQVIRSLTRLCDELKMLIVAEGIETAGERDALAELGCDLMQGYLFGRPQRDFPASVA